MPLQVSPDNSLRAAFGQVTEIFADYSVTLDDFMIASLSTVAPRTVTLLLASEVPEGRVFIIKDETGNASIHNITVAAQAGNNIDGAPTAVINGNRGSLQVLKRPGGYAII